MGSFRELQAAIGTALYRVAAGRRQLDLSDLQTALPLWSSDAIQKALYGLRGRGLVTFAEYLGPGGLKHIELTAEGMCWVEDDAPAGAGATSIVVHGGNVQIGDANIQRIKRE